MANTSQVSYVDVQDSGGTWQVGKVVATQGSSLTVKWLGANYPEFQVECPSPYVQHFRTYTRGPLPFETPRVCPSKQELQHLATQLSRINTKALADHQSITECLRGHILFYTQDYFLNPETTVESQTLQAIAQAVTFWFNNVQSTGQSILGTAWYEVLVTLQFLVKARPQTLLPQREMLVPDRPLCEAIQRYLMNNQHLDLTVLLEVPVLPASPASEAVSMTVFNSLARAIDKLDDARLRSLEVEKYADALLGHGMASKSIHREELPVELVAFCFRMMRANFTKCLEALRFLSRQTWPLSRDAAQYLLQEKFTDCLITPQIHSEFLKNSAGLFRLLAPYQTSNILSHLLQVSQVVSGPDFDRFLTFTTAVFVDQRPNVQTELNTFCQTHARVESNSQALLLLAVTLCLSSPQHDDTIVDQVLSSLWYAGESSLLASVEQKLSSSALAKLGERLFAALQEDSRLLGHSAYVSAACIVLRKHNDLKMKTLACNAITAYLSSSELANDQLTYFVDLISLVVTEDTSEFLDLGMLLERVQEASEQVFEEFVMKVMQNVQNQQLLKTLIDSVAHQESIRSVKCTCFCRLFEQLNKEILKRQYDTNERCDPFLKEEILVRVYSKTELAVRPTLLQHLHMWLTVFSPEKPKIQRQPRVDSFLKTLLEDSDWTPALDLLHSLTLPARGSGLKVTIVENGVRYVEQMGFLDPVYKLRHVLIEKHGSDQFTLFRGEQPIRGKECYTFLKDYFPCEFEVRQEPDRSYTGLNISQNAQLRNALVQTLCDDLLYEQCIELLRKNFMKQPPPLAQEDETLPWEFYKRSIGHSQNVEKCMQLSIAAKTPCLFQAAFNSDLLQDVSTRRMEINAKLTREFIGACLLGFLQYPSKLDVNLLKTLIDDMDYEITKEKLEATFRRVLKERCSTNRKIVLQYLMQSVQWPTAHFIAEIQNSYQHPQGYQTLWRAIELLPPPALEDFNSHTKHFAEDSQKLSDISVQVPNENLKGLLRLLLRLNRPLRLHLSDIIQPLEEFTTMQAARFKNYSVLKLSFQHLEVVPNEFARLHASLKIRAQAWNLFNNSNLKLSRHVGISNLGASCHLNSIIQQLQEIPEFLQIVQTLCGHQLAQELARTFVKLEQSDKKYVSISKLFALLRGYDGEPLNPREQMDVDEVFGLLMNTLEAEVGKDVLKPVFTSTVRVSTQCSHNHVSSRTEEFLTFPVTLKKDLVTSLQEWAAGERFEGDNMYMCEQCGTKREAIRRPRFAHLPHYLLVTLKRFDFDYEEMERVKIHSYFEVPEVLDLRQFAETVRPYTLCGAIVHIGFNATGGHYISYVKQDSNWTKFDDVKITPVDWETVKQDVYGSVTGTSGYFLVYKASDRPPTAKVQWPQILLQEVWNSNYQAFAKHIIFSKPYIDYVWERVCQTDPQFTANFLLTVRLRALEQYPDNFEAILAERGRFQVALADALRQGRLFLSFLLECPVRIVRKALLELFKGWCSPHCLSEELMSEVQQLTCEKPSYIADCLELVKLCNANRFYVTEGLLSFAEQNAVKMRSSRFNSTVFNAREEWSLHLVYANLPQHTTLAQTEVFLRSLKSFKEAEALASWCVQTPGQLAGIWPIVERLLPACETQYASCLFVFCILFSFSIHKTCIPTFSSLWQTLSASAGKMIALFEAGFLCSARDQDIAREFLDPQYLTAIQQQCEYYKHIATTQFIPDYDPNQAAAVLTYLQQARGPKIIHPDQEVLATDRLEYFDVQRNLAEDVEVLKTSGSLLLLKKGEQTLCMDTLDKRLRRKAA